MGASSPPRPCPPAPRPRPRLLGVQVADERPLAGLLAGSMYLLASLGTGALPWLPGTDVSAPLALWALATGAALFGLLALTVIDWTRAPAWVAHVSSAGGLAATAAAMALSGGATSPARFLLLFALVYPSCFYPPWEARPYLVAVVATWASPLLYDAEALRHGVLGELVIVVPAFWMLGFLMVEGKRRMVELRAQADDLARRDPLTGLANRRALMEAVERHAGSRRAGDRLGLLLLDVDDFKSVNTRFGHPGGDGALVAVAAALRRAAREEDVAARFGGDEFALLVRGADAAGMAALAERALAGVRAADPGPRALRLRASAGWALCPGDADDAAGLLAAADGALRAVKARGKDAACGAVPLAAVGQ